MAHPLLKAVTSRSVAAYGHFVLGTEQVGYRSLFVEFLSSGKLYQYEVPEHVAFDMDTTGSFGSYVNTMKATYTGTEISGDTLANLLQGQLSLASASASAKAKPKKRKSGLQVMRRGVLCPPLAANFF